MARLEKLTRDGMQVSAWSGGTTTQLCIFPREAKYADRQFLWRISSATVDLPESDFTPLPDYERLISTLRGGITLTHDQGAPIALAPYEVHRFLGGAATHCAGTCTDFNLMLRRGKAEGSMQAVRLSGESRELALVHGTKEVVMYCAAGCCRIRAGETTLTLSAGEAAVGNDLSVLTITAEDAVLMICQMRICDSNE